MHRHNSLTVRIFSEMLEGGRKLFSEEVIEQDLSSTPIITLICGYTRHGKDTFGKDSETHSEYDKWLIFGTCSSKFIRPQSIKLVSFAEELKQKTLVFLGLNLDWKYLEPFKDTLQVADPQNPTDMRVLRAWYIWYGAEKRKEDLDYWCKSALPMDTIKSVAVTDFRFENEYDYTKREFDVNQAKSHHLQTIRVFRSEVPIPEASIESEHNLDKFQTDFIAVTSYQDLKIVQQMFPQYTKHNHRIVM